MFGKVALISYGRDIPESFTDLELSFQRMEIGGEKLSDAIFVLQFERKKSWRYAIRLRKCNFPNKWGNKIIVGNEPLLCLMPFHVKHVRISPVLVISVILKLIRLYLAFLQNWCKIQCKIQSANSVIALSQKCACLMHTSVLSPRCIELRFRRFFSVLSDLRGLVISAEKIVTIFFLNDEYEKNM